MKNIVMVTPLEESDNDLGGYICTLLMQEFNAEIDDDHTVFINCEDEQEAMETKKKLITRLGVDIVRRSLLIQLIDGDDE